MPEIHWKCILVTYLILFAIALIIIVPLLASSGDDDEH